jgi:ABC-type branched-subunit amino acid transport system ATPase component
MLELKNVTVHYGTAEAIKDITISIEEGSVVSIIGANGAGKNTILRAYPAWFSSRPVRLSSSGCRSAGWA